MTRFRRWLARMWELYKLGWRSPESFGDVSVWVDLTEEPTVGGRVEFDMVSENVRVTPSPTWHEVRDS